MLRFLTYFSCCFTTHVDPFPFRVFVPYHSVVWLVMRMCLFCSECVFWTEECEIGFEATTQAKWCRLFFLSFHVCGVILVNNLVTAFIINSFMTQLKVSRERTVRESIGNGKTTIHHAEAEFDGSEVTGTKTSLKGKFIARIRHDPGRYVRSETSDCSGNFSFVSNLST